MLRMLDTRWCSMGSAQLSKPWPLQLSFETWTPVLLIPHQCCSLLHMSYSKRPLPVCHLPTKKVKDWNFFPFSQGKRGDFWNPEDAGRMSYHFLTASPGSPIPEIVTSAVGTSVVAWLAHQQLWLDHQVKNPDQEDGGYCPKAHFFYLTECHWCFISHCKLSTTAVGD